MPVLQNSRPKPFCAVDHTDRQLSELLYLMVIRSIKKSSDHTLLGTAVSLVL